MLFLVFILIICTLLLLYIWRKRRFYYYTWKIPGPFSLPIIGPVSLIKSFLKCDIHTTFIKKMCEKQPSVFKFWLAQYFCIVNSKPEEVEIVLNTFLEKTSLAYGQIDDIAKNNLMTIPLHTWRSRRRVINHSFSSKIICSFHDIFVKYSKKFVTSFCNLESTDLLPNIWKNKLESTYETLTDLDPGEIELDLYSIKTIVMRIASITIKRMKKFWLLIPHIWKLSNHYRETENLRTIAENFGTKVISKKKEQMATNENCNQDNHFLQRLLKNGNLENVDIIDELTFMYLASSETTAVTVNNVIVMLGIYPEVQEKIYEEILSVMENPEKDFSLEDIKRLHYLECVIKETLRLFPAVPFIARYVDKDFKLGSYTYPKGSNVIIPIYQIHRNPNLWSQPSKFIPDRFLPEQNAKRHPCAFIPFSFGPRNCIGLKYAMLNLKISVADIIKNFVIEELNYKRLEDVEVGFHLVMKIKGYCTKLTRRG